MGTAKTIKIHKDPKPQGKPQGSQKAFLFLIMWWEIWEIRVHFGCGPWPWAAWRNFRSRILWRKLLRRESRAGCCEVAWRSSLDLSIAMQHGLSVFLTTAWLEQLKKTVSASSHSYYSWVDILMSVLGQGSDTQPSLMIDPSEGQTAIVASVESSKQTCHRFYLRFHTFIHIQSRTRCKFVNVLQQILQCCQSTACVKGRPSKDRISRLWSPSPTALSAHLGTGARHFWEKDTFGYIFFCMFGVSYIFHDSIYVCISSFAGVMQCAVVQHGAVMQWFTSVRKCCNVLTYR